MFGFIEALKEKVFNKYLGLAVRKALDAVALALLASSVPAVVELGKILAGNADPLAVAITGLITIAGTTVWSFIQKKNSKPKDE